MSSLRVGLGYEVGEVDMREEVGVFSGVGMGDGDGGDDGDGFGGGRAGEGGSSRGRGVGGGGSGRGTGRAGVVGGAVQGPVYSLDSLRSLPGKSAEGLRQMHRLSTSMALAGELNVRALNGFLIDLLYGFLTEL